MALQNNPHLYTFGNERVSSTPSLNLYAQIQQRREGQRLAKEDAFKDYINNLNTKITPTGVRTQDLPAFEEMKNKWMDFGLKNKNALQKNDIPTQTEFNRMYQGLMNLTMRSKAEEEKKKPYVEIMLDPAKRSKTSSRLIDDIHSHDEPLLVRNANGELEENRTRKTMDFAENYFNPQLDFDKEFTGWSKGMERGKTYSENPIKRDSVSGTATFGTEEKFAPEQIMQIADNAIKGVKGNQEAFNFYQHKLETIADEDLQKLNKAFQSVYGKGAQYVQPDGKMINDQNLIDTPEELAAAEAIMQGQSMVKKGEEMRLDKELANQRAVNNIYLNKGDGGGAVTVGNAFDDFQDAQYKNFSVKGGVFYNPDGTTKSGSVFLTPNVIPGTVRAALKSSGFEQKDFDRGVDAVLKDGQVISISNKKIGTITRPAMGGVYQPKMDTEPLKGNKLKFGKDGKSGKTPVYKGLDKNGNPIFE